MRTTIPRAAGVLAAAWFLLTGPAARAGEDLRFNRDVLPLLADTCFRCHGPAVKKAGLRLDQRDVVLKPTESGAVPIVPGNAQDSEIIRRIFSADDSEVMPPPSARKVLSAGQKALVKRWVEEGAAYEGHWSFVAPRKDAVPTGPQPMEHRARPGGLVERLGCGGCRRPVRDGDGQRYWRVDPLAGRLVRAGRSQADLRPGQPRRDHAAVVQPRPCRAADLDR